MAAPLDEEGFHPEDPTKPLWKKLLRSKPIVDGRPAKTKSQKRAIAIRVQEYYSERPHPRKGKPFGKKRKK